jgi:putative transcriptional regulator
MNEDDFASLLRGVKEMAAHAKGDIVHGAVETRIDPPDVRRIREAVDVTQRELAALLGVSQRTLENWEQHRTQPTGPARALLRVFERNPAAVVEALRA